MIGHPDAPWKGREAGIRWRTLPDGSVATWPAGGVQGVRVSEGRELATVQACASKWGHLTAAAAARTAVPTSWLLGIMVAESGGNAAAVSPAGAIGLMQIMPMHARGRDLRDPAVNVNVGADLLAEMRAHGLDLVESASCYNAGPGKGWRPKPSAHTSFGFVEEVPARLRGTTPWGSYYTATILRANNAAIAAGGGLVVAGPGGAAALAVSVLALFFFARYVL